MEISHSNMTVITTRYIGPSNTKSGRIVADAGMKRRIIISYAHDARNATEAHDRAAIALCDKFQWKGCLRSGGMERGFAYIFVEA